MLFALATILCECVSAQNYEAIRTDAEFFYVDSASRDIIGLRIDLTKMIGDDIYYYNFKQIRPTDTGCYIGNGNSWLGDQVVKKPDGTFIFTVYASSPPDSAHIYRILTHSNLNQPWKLYCFHTVNDYIEAKLIEIQMMTFLGITDSVQVIQLTRKDAARQVVESPANYKKLLLSKNYGLIRLLKFDDVPYYEMYKFYDMAGKTSPETGVTNLKTMQIYDFQPGDEFHTYYFARSYINPNEISAISTISRVLERIDYTNADSVTYRLKQCQSSCLYSTEEVSNCTNRTDTIYQTYSVFKTPEFETEPLETVPVSSINDWATFTTMGFMVEDTKLPIYNIPFKALHSNLWWNNNNDCYTQIIFDGCYLNEYYFKGLGGPYYYCDEAGWGSSNMLVYYKKGSVTWGSPLNCDSLLQVSIPDYTNTKRICIFPNPTPGVITFSLPTNFGFPAKLDISDISGRLAGSFRVVYESQAFDFENLPSGLYIYQLTSAKGEIFRGKIIRQ